MKRFAALALVAMLGLAGQAKAEAAKEYTIVIKDHRFAPDVVEIPANVKVKLIVDNQDATPEEFESHDFKREKVIQGKSKATIVVGPLEPGEYKFFGEFNEKTAQGKVVVK